MRKNNNIVVIMNRAWLGSRLPLCFLEAAIVLIDLKQIWNHASIDSHEASYNW